MKKLKKRLEIDVKLKRWQVETLLGLYVELSSKWEGNDELDELLKWHIDDMLAALTDLLAYEFEGACFKMRYPEGAAFMRTWWGIPIQHQGSQLVINYMLEVIDKAMDFLRVKHKGLEQSKPTAWIAG